ncbi:MAG: TrkH family potassium uptake protein [Pseudomonadota bacterium]
MQRDVIQRVLGYLLCLFSSTMVPPAMVAWFYGEAVIGVFLSSGLVILLVGSALLVPVRAVRKPLRLRDGYLIVVLFWLVLSIAGALPFMMFAYPQMSLAQALFESFSGLTTTGATVIVGLDYLPRAVLFYRQELQWLGGMGIIVLAVAILPMLGIGGMQLYQAETSGPHKDSKLTPRIAQTAKALWLIYLALTVACGTAYWLAGMSPFDAVGHAFSTVAIGGFSTHDDSIGFFNSGAIETVAIVFMVLAGVNFSLHFLAVRGRGLRPYRDDAEFNGYIGFLCVAAVLTVLGLLISGAFTPLESIRHGVFHVVSIATTTGFSTTDFYNWPGSIPFLLLCASFVGGCAGSTGGGMKVIRVLLLFRQGVRELNQLVHPRAKLVVKLGHKAIPPRVQEVVWGFFAAYVAVFVVFIAVLLSTGIDHVTAFSAVVASMNNLGPGLNQVGANYAQLGDFPLLVLCLAMLMGRLEIFTLLVLFTPAFWRR